jgi:hypothetical protein
MNGQQDPVKIPGTAKDRGGMEKLKVRWRRDGWMVGSRIYLCEWEENGRREDTTFLPSSKAENLPIQKDLRSKH